MTTLSVRRATVALAAVALLFPAAKNIAQAEIYINEIFLDPGGAGQDDRDEYIELRGTPGMSLANHYLIFIEAEDNRFDTGGAGLIENIFSFGDDPLTSAVEEPFTLGTDDGNGNGFLTIRQKGSLYTAPPTGVTDLINTGSGVGYGNGATSSIRAQDESDPLDDNTVGRLENGGWTAMLIRDDSGANAPFLGQDLDQGNDGLDPASNDVGDWNDHWTILDSIAMTEPGEGGNARYYGAVNYGNEYPGQPLPPILGGPEMVPDIEPGAVYVPVGFEIEYLGRWGDSTGQTPDDWHVSNLSDDPLTGSSGVPGTGGIPDWRQAGDPHGVGALAQFVETTQGVPYGTALTTTIGSSNLFILDGDFGVPDGDVDGDDLAVWEANLGFGIGDDGFFFSGSDGPTATRTHGDADNNRIVDLFDLMRWQRNFTGAAPVSAVQTVPEPASAVLALLTGAGLLLRRRR